MLQIVCLFMYLTTNTVNEHQCYYSTELKWREIVIKPSNISSVKLIIEYFCIYILYISLYIDSTVYIRPFYKGTQDNSLKIPEFSINLINLNVKVLKISCETCSIACYLAHFQLIDLPDISC